MTTANVPSRTTIDREAHPSGAGVRFRSAGLDTPIGRMTLLAHDNRPELLAALAFPGEDPLARYIARHGYAAVAAGEPTALLRALERYFEGEVGLIDLLNVEAPGTEFQQRVWQELRRIPVGTVISYAELARRIGRPSAVRAVARANATNPVAVVVPCHRVVASDGSLHGYAGGIDRKSWLLKHEARFMDRGLPELKGLT